MSKFTKKCKFASVTNCLNEEDFIGGFLDLMDVDVKVVIISDISYSGNKIKYFDNSEKIALERGAIVIKCSTSSQVEMRNYGIALLQGMGIDYAFIADADEWYPRKTLENYKQFIQENPADAYRVKFINCFRKPSWQSVAPLDKGSIICIDTQKRMPKGYKRDLLDTHGFVKIIPEHEDLGRIYHFSYAKSPKDISEKLRNFSHADEVIDGWFTNVFLKFTPDMKNFHPTSPEFFPECRIIQLPKEIKDKFPKI